MRLCWAASRIGTVPDRLAFKRLNACPTKWIEERVLSRRAVERLMSVAGAKQKSEPAADAGDRL